MKFGDRAMLEAIPRKTIAVPITWFDACPRDEEGNPVLANDKGYEPDTVLFHMRLQEMNGTGRDRFEISAFKTTKNGSGTPSREIDPLYLRARLVTLCLVDGEGNRLYDDGQVQLCSDRVAASILNKLFAAAQKLNGLDATVEAAAKNSPSDLEDDSTSGSLSTSEKPLLNS